MANGRNKGRKVDPKRDGDGFMALPWAVLDSPAYRRLSHPARSLLLEIARQYVKDNNGQLLLSREHMRSRGWNSSDVLTRAKRALLDGGFIHETVTGQWPAKASWYAVTWYSLDRHSDYDPGAAETFVRGAYRKGLPMKNEPLRPSDGTRTTQIRPSHGTEEKRVAPSHGPIRGVFAPLSVPSDGHHLDMPSAAPKKEGQDIPAGRYIRLTRRPLRLFTGLLVPTPTTTTKHTRASGRAAAMA